MPLDNQPLSDAALAELDRLRETANSHKLRISPQNPARIETDSSPNGYVGICVWATDAESFIAIHNAYPALRERLRLAEAERDRDEWRNVVDYYAQQFQWIEENGDTYTKDALLDFIRRTISNTDWEKALSDRDTQQRREGAVEAYERAADMLSVFPGGADAEEMMRDVAKRLRQGGK